MGFFSQDCQACGHPALSSHATNHINRWMEKVVVVRPNGNRFEGWYDGYGRLIPFEQTAGEIEPWVLSEDDLEDGYVDGKYVRPWMLIGGSVLDLPGATVWHEACWTIAGKPTEYQGDSRHSYDQGYFFDDADHAMRKPKTFADVVKGRALADKASADYQAEMAAAMAEYNSKKGKK